MKKGLRVISCRRYWQAFVLVLILSLGVAMVGLPRLSLGAEKLPKSIVSMAYGGEWGKVYKQVIADPWSKKNRGGNDSFCSRCS